MPPLVGDHDAAVEVDHAAVEIGAGGEVAAMPPPKRPNAAVLRRRRDGARVAVPAAARRNHNLASSKVDWLHRRLLACGHDANVRSHHFAGGLLVRGRGERFKEGMPELISSINMRLKLGQCTLAKHLYERVPLMQLTDAQIEVAARKLGAARRSPSAPRRGWPGEFASMQDEVTQIFALPPATMAEVSLPEKAKMLPMMRAEGHRANKGGDFEAARRWFDCAHSLSQHPSDLLSAANTTKLVPTSRAAEALSPTRLAGSSQRPPRRHRAQTRAAHRGARGGGGARGRGVQVGRVDGLRAAVRDPTAEHERVDQIRYT